MGLIASLICACSNGGKKTTTNQNSTKEQNKQTEAWDSFVDSVEKLKKQDNITIYDLIGTFDTVHEDYDSEQSGDKKIMKSLKGGYNFYTKKILKIVVIPLPIQVIMVLWGNVQVRGINLIILNMLIPMKVFFLKNKSRNMI